MPQWKELAIGPEWPSDAPSGKTWQIADVLESENSGKWRSDRSRVPEPDNSSLSHRVMRGQSRGPPLRLLELETSWEAGAYNAVRARILVYGSWRISMYGQARSLYLVKGSRR
jgi:hypothetical protein